MSAGALPQQATLEIGFAVERLRGEEPRPLHADDGGDCCYAPDAGRAIALLMNAETLRHNTYNVSSGRPFTFREFAEALRPLTPGLSLENCRTSAVLRGMSPEQAIRETSGETDPTAAQQSTSATNSDAAAASAAAGDDAATTDTGSQEKLLDYLLGGDNG